MASFNILQTGKTAWWTDLLLYIEVQCRQPTSIAGPVLVSYSYFEKDAVQLGNAEFFWKVGMGLSPGFEVPLKTDFVVVVSGELCT